VLSTRVFEASACCWMVVSVAALQLLVINVTFSSYETSNDAHVNGCHKYSSSNLVTALCWLSGATMTAWYYVKWLTTVTVKLVSVGCYKAKLRSITFMLTYLCTTIFIFLFVPLGLAPSLINLFVHLHNQEIKILVTPLTVPSVIRQRWSESQQT
jgi:hypothetical protein